MLAGLPSRCLSFDKFTEPLLCTRPSARAQGRTVALPPKTHPWGDPQSKGTGLLLCLPQCVPVTSKPVCVCVCVYRCAHGCQVYPWGAYVGGSLQHVFGHLLYINKGTVAFSLFRLGEEESQTFHALFLLPAVAPLEKTHLVLMPLKPQRIWSQLNNFSCRCFCEN